MAAKITVLGGGAWGTAIAHLLANNGHDILIWCHEPDVAEDINFRHENSYYFSSIELPVSIKATGSLQEAIEGSSIIFEAVPVMFLRETLEHAREFIHDDQLWVVLSKGIEKDSHFFPSQIIDELFEKRVRVAALGGPNFARELAEKNVSATAVASSDPVTRRYVADLVASSYFIPYLTDDIIGVQVGGALKNVIALSLGIAYGAQAGDNTRAFILTQGLSEMALFAKHCGARSETLYGLSGFGDLVLTSTGILSKNMRFGKLLGEGNLFSHISREGILPEGINTIQSVKQIVDSNELNLPLMSATYDLIFNGRSFNELLECISCWTYDDV